MEMLALKPDFWSDCFVMIFFFFWLCHGRMICRFVFHFCFFTKFCVPWFFVSWNFFLIFLLLDFLASENFYGKFGSGFLGKIFGAIIFFAWKILVQFFCAMFFLRILFDDFFFELVNSANEILVGSLWLAKWNWWLRLGCVLYVIRKMVEDFRSRFVWDRSFGKWNFGRISLIGKMNMVVEIGLSFCKLPVQRKTE